MIKSDGRDKQSGYWAYNKTVLVGAGMNMLWFGGDQGAWM